MHEIGHLLGLAHLEGMTMDRVVSDIAMAVLSQCPDEATIVRLSRRLGVSGLVSCTL